MATAFRDWPWPIQALFFLGLAVVLIAAGFYVPGLPVTTVRNELEAAQQEEKPLEADVASLRVYKQRRAELQSEMDALSKQLATLQTIVPEDKKSGRVHHHDSERCHQLRRLHSPPQGAAHRSQTVLFRSPV